MKKFLGMAAAMVAVVLMLTSCPHPESADVPDVMLLTLDYSNLSNKDAVTAVKVRYGYAGNDAGDEHYAPEVSATISGYKATVECDKTYSNEYNWFNNTKIQLLDANGSAVNCQWDQTYFEYNEAGFTMTAADKTTDTGLLTLTFTGFEIPGGSVSVTYGHDQSGTTFKTEQAVVAQDGKSATVTLSSDYAKEGKWFNNTTVTVAEASGNIITPAISPAPWFDFDKNGMSLELIVDSATYIDLTAESFENTAANAWINCKNICSVTDTIAQLKITVSNVTGYTWMCYGSCWVSDTDKGGWIENLTADSNGNFTATISDSTVIAKLQNAGIIVFGGGGDGNGTGTVTVSYVAAN